MILFCKKNRAKGRTSVKKTVLKNLRKIFARKPSDVMIVYYVSGNTWNKAKEWTRIGKKLCIIKYTEKNFAHEKHGSLNSLIRVSRAADPRNVFLFFILLDGGSMLVSWLSHKSNETNACKWLFRGISWDGSPCTRGIRVTRITMGRVLQRAANFNDY